MKNRDTNFLEEHRNHEKIREQIKMCFSDTAAFTEDEIEAAMKRK